MWRSERGGWTQTRPDTQPGMASEDRAEGKAMAQRRGPGGSCGGGPRGFNRCLDGIAAASPSRVRACVATAWSSFVCASAAALSAPASAARNPVVRGSTQLV